MLRAIIRRSDAVDYLVDDEALELEGVRDAGAARWLRGVGNQHDARDVKRVLTTTDRATICGYDLIVAAPRPISILVAVDDVAAPHVVRAHQHAVAAALAYLEGRAVVVRLRRGGNDSEQSAQWGHVVAFTHGVNRHAEPHLHDHVLVGSRPHGATTVLDSRALFAHLHTGDAVYRTVLRHQIAATTSWRPWRSFSGVEHVTGLDEGYRKIWPGHRDERGEKFSWTRDAITEQWSRDLTNFEPSGVIDEPTRDRALLDEHAFGAAFEGRWDVGRRHVIAAWADAAVFGTSLRDLDRSVDLLYPELLEGQGVRELLVSTSRARMVGAVRTRGPRPLADHQLSQWLSSSRERSRSR